MQQTTWHNKKCLIITFKNELIKSSKKFDVT